jgi:hypothetical protein
MLRKAFLVVLAFLFAGVGLGPQLVIAQDASPVASPVGPSLEGTVVVGGLANPRGFAWDANGVLYVSLAGSGGPNEATETAPTTNAIGPFHAGLSAAVARVEASGCPVIVAGGLPSTADATGGVLGAEDVAFLGGELYVAVDGGGPVHGNPDNPSGIYHVLADGSVELVADLSAWVRANPVAELPGDYDPDAAGYSLVADEAAGALWVGDPNNGQILSVKPDGTVARIADLSAGHPVPTKLALDPEGGVYVGTLTAVPFADGTAKVMHVDADGTATDVWTGLTAVTSVAVGPDGTLYATELATGNLAEPPFLQPGTGKIVRQTGMDSSEEVVTGLDFPVHIEFGSDGALYLATPALGADAGTGVILRYNLDGSAPEVVASGDKCVPLTTAPSATPVA